MSEPMTAAGRRLLGPKPGPDHLYPGWVYWQVNRDAIIAIEQEARADLAARIVAAVEGLRVRSTVKDETPWQQGFRQSRNETVVAVLDVIREASDD